MRRRLRALLLLCALPAWASLAIGSEGADPPRLPDLRDTEIVLQWDDFKRLVEATFEDTAGPEVTPPHPWSLDRIDYQGEAHPGYLTVTSRITVTVLEPEEWVTIPLFFGVAMTAARELPGSLVTAGGQYRLVARGEGRYTFELDFVVGGTDRPGRNTLSFTPPEASVSYMRVTAAETVEKLEAPELVGPVSEDGRVVLGAVPHGTPINIVYHLPLVEEAAGPGVEEVKQEPKLFLEEKSLATVGEGLMTLRSIYDYQVLHAPVTTFRFEVPEGVDVLSVEGVNLVEGFKLLKGEGGVRILEARTTFEVEGAYQLVVLYERDLGDTDVTTELTLLAPLGVERATGTVGIEAEANAEVETKAADGMVALDVTEVPREIWDSAANPLLLGFRYLGRPFRLDLQITKHEDEEVMVAACDSAFVTMLVTDEGHTLTRVLYQVRNNRKQFLEITLPEGADVWTALVKDRAVKPAKHKTRPDTILIPLPRSTDPGQAESAGDDTFPAEIIYFLPTPPVRRTLGTLTLHTPAVDVPVSELGLSVYLPRRRSYEYLSGSLQPNLGMAAHFTPGAAWNSPSLGDFFAPSKDMAAPAASFEAKQMEQDRSFKKKMEEQAYGRLKGGTHAGSLPVRITFPEEGVNLRYRKLLAIGDPDDVRLLYVHSAVVVFLALLYRGLGVLAGVALVRILARGWATGGFKPGRSGLLIVISVALVVPTSLYLGLRPSLFTFWLVLVAIVYGLHAVWKAWSVARLERLAGPPDPARPSESAKEPPAPPEDSPTS